MKNQIIIRFLALKNTTKRDSTVAKMLSAEIIANKKLWMKRNLKIKYPLNQNLRKKKINTLSLKISKTT